MAPLMAFRILSSAIIENAFISNFVVVVNSFYTFVDTIFIDFVPAFSEKLITDQRYALSGE